MALLSSSSILPQRALQGLQVSRQPILSVAAGQPLLVELSIENPTRQTRVLLQGHDYIPVGLGPRQSVAIATIAAKNRYYWRYELTPERRGIYTWQTVQLRTAAPLGLFWCSREHKTPAQAVVYPQILPLNRCPVIDGMGAESGRQSCDLSNSSGYEGLTRALRPYRWGDPMRLIHWRTSARYGELRVRELETLTSRQAMTIALDTTAPWDPDTFELAVIAAASLFDYALQRGLGSQFWSPATGLLLDRLTVMNALAAIQYMPQPDRARPRPREAMIWLSSQAVDTLPRGSRTLLFPIKTAAHRGTTVAPPSPATAALIIDPSEELLRQLQSKVIVSPH
jgi:uncharacterized protein (DUF58 family)